MNTVQAAPQTVHTRIPSCSHGTLNLDPVKLKFIWKIRATAQVVQAEARTAFRLKVITIILSLLPRLVKGNRIITCSLTRQFTVGNVLRNGLRVSYLVSLLRPQGKPIVLGLTITTLDLRLVRPTMAMG